MDSFEKGFADQLEVLVIIDGLQQEKDTILQQRSLNLPKAAAAAREAFRNNKNVKSDVKKSSSFGKKIRSINTEGIQQCIRETDTLNLTQYTSEIVASILATTYKAADVSHMVKLCVSLHLKYDDFTEPLVTGLKSLLLSVPPEDDPEAGKKKRISIRFAVELYQAGILIEDEFFCQLLRNLLGRGKTAQMNAAGKPITDLMGLSTLVKYGSELLFGYPPHNFPELAARAEKKLEELPVKCLTNNKVSGILRNLLNETYDTLCQDLEAAHKDFRSKESKYEKDKVIHGSVTEQKQIEFDCAKRLFEKLLSVVTVLSESTGMPIPELKIEREEEEGGGLSLFEGTNNLSLVQTEDPNAAGGGFYGDAETRSFYEDLPDLLSLVPLSVLGLTIEQAATMREEWAAARNDTITTEDDSAKIEQDIDQQQQEQLQETEAELETDASTEAVEEDDKDTETAAPAAITTESTSTAAAAAPTVEGTEEESRGHKLDTLLTEKLLECYNKQRCDDWCVSYCYLHSKNAKKKLITALTRIPRSRGELAPCYARIIASLARLYPDILPVILDALRKEFYGILKARKQTHVDSKVRNVRYQAELVKFRAAPPITAFRMIKALLAEFNPHNVEMLVSVLETCGRYLYLMPFTHTMMVSSLDTMMRLRRARNLDLNQQTMLESAYFAVKPPDRTGKAVKKELTVAQLYARYLLLEKLEQPKVSIETVIKLLRRLPWLNKEENIDFHVVKASLKIAKSKYVSIQNLADCLSGLSKYQPNVIIQIVDRIFEEIQRAMDSPYKREIQRLLGMVHLFGELYNYTAITSTVIFDLLYSLINFGHTVAASADTTALTAAAAAPITATNSKKYDPRVIFEADLPNDLCRAQLVCELLNTVGLYYVRGIAKERLSRFLTYFQRYLFTKQFVPMHVEFTILDTFDALEQLAREAVVEVVQSDAKHKKYADIHSPIVVHFKRYDTFEAANAAVEAYEAVDLSKAGSTTTATVEDDEENDRGRTYGGGDEDNEDNNSVDKGDDGNDSSDDTDSDDSSDDNDDTDEEDDEDVSEREAALMLEKMRLAEEDDEFEKAFKNIMQESVSCASNRYQDVNKMAIPAVLPKPKNSFRQAEDQDDNSNRHHQIRPQMAFKLLSRDTRGRIETRQLFVPQDNAMAQKVAKAEEEARLERQRIKERTLMMSNIMNEEEYDPDDEVNEGGKFFGQREAYTGPAVAAPPQQVSSGRGGGGRGSGGRSVTSYRRPEDSKKAHDTLDLDGFLAETNNAEIRRIKGRSQGGQGQGHTQSQQGRGGGGV